jgi:Cu(I)/Ag(I) efflux system membrane fusion protein
MFFLLIILLTGCKSKESNFANHRNKGNSQSVFIDPSRVQLYGITTKKAVIKDLTKSIRTVGIVKVDERKIYKIQTKIKGWIEKLYIDFTNKPVFKGAPLFTIYSPDLYATQEEYLLALNDLQKKPLGMFSEELKKSNKALLQAAKERLTLWDIPKEEIQRLNVTKKPKYDLTIYSPVNGIVLEKNAFSGMNVGEGINLFTVADLSLVWLFADIYEQDISLVELNQKVDFTITSFPDLQFFGTLSFINYVVDPITRSVKVRIDVDNQSYLLKPEMYGNIEVKVNLGKHLAIPQNSVIQTGNRNFIFIEEAIGHYILREVNIGYLANGYYQVLSGVKEDENVVTNSQFLLDSESRILGFGSGEIKHGAH